MTKQVKFTRLENAHECAKHYRGNTPNISNGTFETIATDFPFGFCNILRDITASTHSAICLGIPKNGVEKQAFVTASEKKNSLHEAIARTKEDMMFSDFSLVCIDHDSGKYSYKEIVHILEKVHPLFKNAAYVAVHSSSAAIRNLDDDSVSKDHKYHIYFAVQGDVEALFKDLIARTHIAGYSETFITKNFSVLVRNTIFDETVTQVNRVIFESGMVGLPSHLVQVRMKPVVKDGHIISYPFTERDTDGYKQRQIEYEQVKLREKQKVNPEAERKETHYLESIIDPKARKKKKEQFEASRNGVLKGDYLLFKNFQDFHTGQGVKVADILKAPHLYDGETFLDPIEPSYGNYSQKAKIFALNNRVILTSFAHGQTCYKLEVDYKLGAIPNCEHKFSEIRELSFEEATQELKATLDSYFSFPYSHQRRARMLCLAGQTGLRKSSLVAWYVANYSGNVLLVVPTLRNANDFKEAIIKVNPNANVAVSFSPSSDKGLCPFLSEMNAQGETEIKFSKSMCESDLNGETLTCPYFDECPYQRTRETNANIRIISHEALFRGWKSRWNDDFKPNLRIIDESFDSKMVKDESISLDSLKAGIRARELNKEETLDISFLIEMFNGITALATEENEHNADCIALRDHIESLRGNQRVISKLQTAIEIGSKKSLKVSERPVIPNMTREQLLDTQRHNSSIEHLSLGWAKTLLELVSSSAPVTTPPFFTEQLSATNQDNGDEIKYVSLVHVKKRFAEHHTSRAIPTLFLDGTAQPDIYKRFMSAFTANGYADLEFKRINYDAKRFVVQVRNNNLGKSTIKRSEDYHKANVLNLKQVDGAEVVTHKDINSNGIYFHNSRGRNDYDKQNLVVIYGNTCCAPRTVKVMSLGLYGDCRDERFDTISFDTYESSQQYLFRDGNPAAEGQVEGYRYNSHLVQGVKEYLEHSEFLQASGRLRYDEHRTRYLVLASSRPAPIYVDHMISTAELTESYLERLLNGITPDICNDYLILAKYLTRSETNILKKSVKGLMAGGLSKKSADRVNKVFDENKLYTACEAVDDFFNIIKVHKGKFVFYRAEAKVKVDLQAFIASLRKSPEIV